MSPLIVLQGLRTPAFGMNISETTSVNIPHIDSSILLCADPQIEALESKGKSRHLRGPNLRLHPSQALLKEKRLVLPAQEKKSINWIYCTPQIVTVTARPNIFSREPQPKLSFATFAPFLRKGRHLFFSFGTLNPENSGKPID